MQVQPYLFFEGRCEEALEFYKRAVGAEVVSLMRYKDSPDPAMCSAATADKVMHAAVRVGDSIVFASDGRCEGQSEYKGFALSLSAASPEEAEHKFAALSEGGKVVMPMSKTFFAERFGMTVDRFGVTWMVIVMK